MSPSSTMLTTGKRVLIFSLSYFPKVGGAEIAVKEITDRMPEIEFDIVTLRFGRSDRKFQRVENVNVYRIGGGIGYFSKILFIPQAVLFAMRRKYNAYWCIMTYMLFPVVLLRWLGSKVPYVLTLQDGDSFEKVFFRVRILPFLPLLLYGFRHANKIQTISSFLAEWPRKMGYKGKIEIISNGVDIKLFPLKFNVHGWKDAASILDDNEIGYIFLWTFSRLVEKNGIKDIIKAINLLNAGFRLHNKFKLLIIGEGYLKEELLKLAKELNIEEQVKFLGYKNQREIIETMLQEETGQALVLNSVNVWHIFVRPSVSEGFGSAYIEAMAAGLPIIATPVGGIPDFLKDGETGLFCEVNNPKSIADKVMQYIKNSKLTEKIMQNSRKLVEEKYDWNLIADEMKTKVFDKV